MTGFATLIEDIYGVLGTKQGITIETDILARYGANVARHLQDTTTAVEGARKPRAPKTVYASEIGHPCLLKLALRIAYPEKAEPMEPWVHMKFLYGDIIEETTLALARAAGHSVTDEQFPIQLKVGDGWMVSGRIDAVVDGVIVDVKSCSEYAFAKYKNEGIKDWDDSFGYRTQLEVYMTGIGMTKNTWTGDAGWIMVNKSSGALCTVSFTDGRNGEECLSWLEAATQDLQWSLEDLERKSGMVDGGMRPFDPIPEGKSGNEKLDTICSYCEFKKTCYPGVRTFIYAGKGPVFLSTVVKEPNVPEVK